MTDRKKLFFAALLAVVAVVGFSLLISRWERKSATDESQSISNMVTRANEAATQAAQQFNRGT